MSISLKGLTVRKPDFKEASSVASSRDVHHFARVLTSLFFGALLLVGAAIIGLLLYGASHTNQIYEGVSIGGIDVGGMSRSEARVAVNDTFSQAASSPVLLVSKDKKFYFNPYDSGINVDTQASLDAAFSYGRSGSIWSRTQDWAGALLQGHDVPMQLQLDTAKIDATLQGAAKQLVRDPQPAYLTYDASGQPTVVPELPGIVFDTVATREQIIQRVRDHSSEAVTLATNIQQADTTVEDLQTGVAQIESVMQAPLVIGGPDTSWSIEPTQMQSLLSYSKGDQTIDVDRAGVEAFVAQIAQSVDQGAKDAGITVDDNGKLAALPGQPAISVNQGATADSVVTALQNGTHNVDLVYTTTAQGISDEIATGAAERGETLLNTGVTVTWDGGSIKLTRADLLKALTVKIRDGQKDPFVFGFDGSSFEQALTQTFKNITVPVKEPRLRLVDGKIVPEQKGESGKAVDVDASIATIVAAASEGTGKAALTIKTVEPTLSMPVISKIHLGDVLAESSTYYGDSSDARRNNVEVASKSTERLVDRALVPSSRMPSSSEA